MLNLIIVSEPLHASISQEGVGVKSALNRQKSKESAHKSPLQISTVINSE